MLIEHFALQADDQAESSLLDVLVDIIGRDIEEPESREKRHTHSMNAWYTDLGGHNAEISPGVGGMPAKVGYL